MGGAGIEFMESGGAGLPIGVLALIVLAVWYFTRRK